MPRSLPPLAALSSAGIMTTTAKATAVSATADDSSPLRIWLLGFASITVMYLTLVTVNLLLLVGLYRYPNWVGLGAVLPYWTYTSVWRRDELKAGSPWPRFSRDFSLLRHVRRYLSLRLVAPAELSRQPTGNEEDRPVARKQQRQYIFAVFPHGTNADYRILMDGMLSEVLPEEVALRTRTLAASVLFRIPGVRETALWTGCVDARRSVAQKLLQSGHSLLVLPGGQEEMLRTARGQERVYAKRRRGFVRLALQHGVPVVPVYVFGTSDHYRTTPVLLPFRRWLLHATGIALPFGAGALGTIWCPRPVRTTVVFGAPLHLKAAKGGGGGSVGASSWVDDAAVDSAHAQFLEALVELFDSHKAALGYGDRHLLVE